TNGDEITIYGSRKGRFTPNDYEVAVYGTINRSCAADQNHPSACRLACVQLVGTCGYNGVIAFAVVLNPSGFRSCYRNNGQQADEQRSNGIFHFRTPARRWIVDAAKMRKT